MSDQPGYGDAEAKQIIARAAEIERDQGHRLDAAALREIGREAGIPQAAVDRAIAEHESALPVTESWLTRNRGTILGGLILAALVLLYAFLRRAA